MKLTVLVFAACLAHAQINLKSPVQSAAVPYIGATQDVDLGTRKLIAAEVRTTGTGPTRIHLSQGVCPTAPDAGYYEVVCLEAGVLYQVTATAKLPLTVKQSVAQVETFPLSSLTVNATGVATIALAKAPAPGTRVDLIRQSSAAADSKSWMMVAAGKAIQVTVPVRVYAAEDVIQVGYVSVE